MYRPAFPGRSIFITGVGRARPRFAPARILACCAQPLYLLTPPGRFALHAGAHRAHASFRRPCGSLWAFGPTAHRAGASLRCRAGNLRPWTLSIYRKRPVAPPFLDMLNPPKPEGLGGFAVCQPLIPRRSRRRAPQRWGRSRFPRSGHTPSGCRSPAPGP